MYPLDLTYTHILTHAHTLTLSLTFTFTRTPTSSIDRFTNYIYGDIKGNVDLENSKRRWMTDRSIVSESIIDLQQMKKEEEKMITDERIHRETWKHAKKQYKINKYKILKNIRQKNPECYNNLIKELQKNLYEMRTKNHILISEYYKRLRKESAISSDSESESESESDYDN